KSRGRHHPHLFCERIRAVEAVVWGCFSRNAAAGFATGATASNFTAAVGVPTAAFCTMWPVTCQTQTTAGETQPIGRRLILPKRVSELKLAFRIPSRTIAFRAHFHGVPCR